MINLYLDLIVAKIEKYGYKWALDYYRSRFNCDLWKGDCVFVVIGCYSAIDAAERALNWIQQQKQN